MRGFVEWNSAAAKSDLFTEVKQWHDLGLHRGEDRFFGTGFDWGFENAEISEPLMAALTIS